jgi:hypothetical protein
MPELFCLRFVKTPGSVQLPAGISRQYQVYRGDRLPEGAPDLVFDLDSAHMRGLTLVRQISGEVSRLECQSRTGAGRWDLVATDGCTLAQISGPGLFAGGWKLDFPGKEPGLELRDPASLGKQIVRSMLNGDTEGLVLLLDGEPQGSITRRHRDEPKGGGGFFTSLKRFVAGRDWVLELNGAEMAPQFMERDGVLVLAAFALAAIVSLEMSSSD